MREPGNRPAFVMVAAMALSILLGSLGCSSIHLASVPAYRDPIVRAGVGAFTVLSAADVGITKSMLDDGAHETNPILGEDPGLPLLLAMKIGGGLVVSGIVELVWRGDQPEPRKLKWTRWIWGTAAATQLVPVIHNSIEASN